MGEGIVVQFGTEEQHGQSRRDVEALLGAGDANVDVVLVHAQVFGQEGADDIDHEGDPVLVADVTDLPQVEKLPAGGLVVLAQEHGRLFRGHPGVHVRIVDVLGEGNLIVHGVDAVVLADVIPAVAEGAAVDDEGLALRADIVLHDRAHRAGAGTGIDDGPAAGTMDQIQQDPLGFEVDIREFLGSHIEERLCAEFHQFRVDVTRESVRVQRRAHG